MATRERTPRAKAARPAPDYGRAGRAPSVHSANGLYLLSMVLIVVLGSRLQSWSASWGLLVTEVGLILVPALLFVWWGRLDARAVLRLRWPGLRLVALGAVVGVGIWGLDVALQAIAAAMLGYAPQSGLAGLPADGLSLTVFSVALAVAAPFSEEVFFRGYLLSAYRRYRPAARLLLVALLFAFFHLQFQGLLALLPIALVLPYLTQRSDSLAPAIAAHMANNSLAAALTIAVSVNPALSSGLALPAALGGAMLIGPLLAAAGLWAFARLTRSPRRLAHESAPAALDPLPGGAVPAVGRRAFWPLGVAGAIFVVYATLEVLLGRFPALLAQRTLQLEPAPWSQTTQLAYDLWNVADKRIGEVDCRFTPEGDVVAFDCVTRQQHFEVQQGSSMYAGGTYQLAQSGRWDAQSMQLLEARFDFQGEFSAWSARVGPDSQASRALSLWLGDEGSRPLPNDVVIAAEWPWRLMALPFGRLAFYGSRFNQVLLAPGAELGQVEPAVAVISGQETLSASPGGAARAWKVVVGGQTAWYAATSPHTLLRYTDGYGVTWTLDRDGPAGGAD